MERNRFRAFLVACFVGVTAVEASGQGFVNVTAQQSISVNNANAYNGSGLSFFDFNGDGWDDLTLCARNSPIRFYQNNQGDFELIPALVDAQGEVKSVTWCDYDNDGDNDLLVVRFSSTPVFYRNNGEMDMEDISQEVGIPMDPGAMGFGASFGDLNRDGFLDLYICNYNWPNGSGATNWVLMNDGMGKFIDVSAQTPASDLNRRSFQCTFSDVNRDLWPDLFVANDKFTRNSLYLNLGNGVMTDATVEFAAGHYMESMCSSPADFDRDGDLDIYVSNSGGNVLLQNNGTVFEDIAPQNQMTVDLLCWGSLWMDYDNNGWEDLYVCVMAPHTDNRNRLFRNNGDGSFDDLEIQGLNADFTNAYSNARGDCNNDGFSDMAVVGSSLLHNRLWQNLGIGGHYLKLDLQGVQSNRQGVGVWIDMYAGGEHSSHYTTCGENYLAQNSGSVILGLGEFESADSLVLSWPSGQVDRYGGLVADQRLHLVEGQSQQVTNNLLNVYSFCANDSVFLALSSADSVLWSDGIDAPERWISNSGIYWLNWWIGGIEYSFGDIEVWEGEAPSWDFLVSGVSCTAGTDGTIVFSPETTEIYLVWDAFAEGDLNMIGAGAYTGTVWDASGCSFPTTVNLNEPEPLSVETFITHPSCFGSNDGIIIPEGYGGTPPYTFSWTDMNPEQLNAGTYTFQCTDANNCQSELAVELVEPMELNFDADIIYSTPEGLGSIWIEPLGGTPPYTISWVGGVIGKSAQGLDDGIYSCIITDANGCSLEAEFAILYLGNEEAETPHLTVSPNPSLRYFELIGNFKRFTLSDACGRVCQVTTTAIQKGIRIDMEKYAAGMYFLQVIGHDDAFHSLRLIKE